VNVNKALQRYIEAATGLSNLTKAKAEQLAKQLAKQGEVATDNVGDLVDELLERQKKNRETIHAIAKAETQRVVRAMGLATNDEVERLQKQVADLKRELAKTEASTATTATPKKSTAKKSTAKKSTAKKSTAKKATAKKSTAKKSTAKKSS
jgi:polyhydroxyalkanoate synthesis regulator phasin